MSKDRIEFNFDEYPTFYCILPDRESDIPFIRDFLKTLKGTVYECHEDGMQNNFVIPKEDFIREHLLFDSGSEEIWRI